MSTELALVAVVIATSCAADEIAAAQSAIAKSRKQKRFGFTIFPSNHAPQFLTKQTVRKGRCAQCTVLGVTPGADAGTEESGDAAPAVSPSAGKILMVEPSR